MDDDENFDDDESQDEPTTITVVNFEEFEAQFNDNSHNQDSVLDGSLDEESENVSQEEGSGDVRCFGGDLIFWLIDILFSFADR